MKCYIKTTKDKYELICGIADTPKELAIMCGVEHKSVLKGLERFRKGENSQWQTIEI